MTIQDRIVKAIQQFSTIIILRHKRPDPDAIGSQMGLAEIIRQSFPKKRVYCGGKQYSGFNWLGKADSIPKSAYENALVIVTDTANRPRIDGHYYNLGKMLIKIDHHPNDDPYGDVMWIDPKASSASELIYDLYAASSALQMDAEAGRLLYAGIVGDTGRFKYPATSSRTFYIASQLAKLNFSLSRVNRREEEIDLSVARLFSYMYSHLNILDSGAAYLVVTNDLLTKLHLRDENTSALVPLPGNIKGVKAWAIFVQQKDQTYRVRLRSNGPTINGLAKRFGGGGHALASGAIVKNLSEVKMVIKQLDQVVTKGDYGKKNHDGK